MPNQIIKDAQLQEDSWQYAPEETETSDLPAGDLVVSKVLWDSARDALLARDGALGVLLGAADEPESIADDLDKLALIAVDFPAFTDGRGYSTARILRERYNYRGDIRATGDVMHDQLQYMTRCGFSSFQLKEGKDLAEAMAGLESIGNAYQADAGEVRPLFRRR